MPQATAAFILADLWGVRMSSVSARLTRWAICASFEAVRYRLQDRSAHKGLIDSPRHLPARIATR